MNYRRIQKVMRGAVVASFLTTGYFFGKELYHGTQARLPDRPVEVVRVMQIENELSSNLNIPLGNLSNPGQVDSLVARIETLRAEKYSLIGLGNYSYLLDEYNKNYEELYDRNKAKMLDAAKYCLGFLSFTLGLTITDAILSAREIYRREDTINLKRKISGTAMEE